MRNPTIVFPSKGVVEVADREVPKPGTGQLLIESRLSLVSTGTELTILSGDFPEGSFWAKYGRYPFVAGYSNLGVVAEAGADVDRSLIGRRVVTRTPHAAWSICHAGDAIAVPDAVEDHEAVFFTISSIVMNSLRRSALKWGETMVVFGLGLLGQFAVRYAAIAGSGKIFAIDFSDARLEMVPQNSSVVALNPRAGDIAPRIRAANHGRLADVAFDAIGAPSLIPGEFAVLRRQGRFVILSSPRGPTAFDFHDLCNMPSYTIIGTHEMSHPSAETLDNPWTAARHTELFFDYLIEKRIDVAPLLTTRIRFTEAPRMYAELLRDRSRFMGVAIDWGN